MPRKKSYRPWSRSAFLQNGEDISTLRQCQVVFVCMYVCMYVSMYVYEQTQHIGNIKMLPLEKRACLFRMLRQGSRPLPPLRASAPLRSRTRSPRAAAGGGRRPQLHWNWWAETCNWKMIKWMEKHGKWSENGAFGTCIMGAIEFRQVQTLSWRNQPMHLLQLLPQVQKLLLQRRKSACLWQIWKHCI